MLLGQHLALFWDRFALLAHRLFRQLPYSKSIYLQQLCASKHDWGANETGVACAQTAQKNALAQTIALPEQQVSWLNFLLVSASSPPGLTRHTSTPKPPK